jgi:RNA polymerase sigma-70 factor, ECF subfamily
VFPRIRGPLAEGQYLNPDGMGISRMVPTVGRCHGLAAMNQATEHRSPHGSPEHQDRRNTSERPERSGAHVLNIDDVRRVLPRMRVRARSLARSREDAEDLVQDTLLYVLRRPRMIGQEDATGYLLQAIRNTWISQHRRQRVIWPEPLDEERHQSSVAAGPDPTAFVGEEFAWWAVKTLPAAYRDVVVTVVFCGLSYREAAEALDVPIGTIMSRLYRARRLLEPALAEAA